MHVGEPFLGPADAADVNKPCLVLDLDETLVHSSFKPVPSPDYIIPVEIEGTVIDVYVLKRPWVDYFMEEMGKIYEVVVFTASLAKYADPLLDQLDKGNVIRWRLFRESCYPHQGNYVKDLTSLGRELGKTIIIDNSPHSYAFQPQNALPISSFIDDPTDNDLLDAIPYLQELAKVDDVSEVLVREFHAFVYALDLLETYLTYQRGEYSLTVAVREKSAESRRIREINWGPCLLVSNQGYVPRQTYHSRNIPVPDRQFS